MVATDQYAKYSYVQTLLCTLEQPMIFNKEFVWFTNTEKVCTTNVSLFCSITWPLWPCCSFKALFCRLTISDQWRALQGLSFNGFRKKSENVTIIIASLSRQCLHWLQSLRSVLGCSTSKCEIRSNTFMHTQAGNDIKQGICVVYIHGKSLH